MSEADIKTEIDPGDSEPTRKPVPARDVSRDSTFTLNWNPPSPEALALLIPVYRIESLIGFGGMGAVYKGWHEALDRPVAVKLLPAELAANADFVARFQREARTLARLQHPGIVAVYDFGQTPAGHLYFVMEFVDGTSLQHFMKDPGLTPDQTYEAMAQICEALQYAHGQEVIHRDIKPANILVNSAGRVKLVDFGIARPLNPDHSDITQIGAAVGTPAYMAPEQWENAGGADQRADIYSLGIMLYEMLTGERPKGQIFPAPSSRAPVDRGIDAVVTKALQYKPEERYQQVSELQVEVHRIRTQVLHPVPVAPLVLPARAPKRSSSGGWLTALLSIALGAAAAAMLWKVRHLDLPPFAIVAAPVVEATSASPTPVAVTPLAVGAPDGVHRGEVRKLHRLNLPAATPVPTLATPTPAPIAVKAATAPPIVVAKATPAPPKIVATTPRPAATPVATPKPTPTPLPPAPTPTPYVAKAPPATPTPDPEYLKFERILRSYTWLTNLSKATIRFESNHVLTFRETDGKTHTAHWWIVGPRAVHYQGNNAVFDPKGGVIWTFDPGCSAYIWGGKAGGTRLNPRPIPADLR